MHAGLCVCALLPRLATRTRLELVIHRSEDRKSTNTGRLAAECLVNAAVHVRGHEDADVAITFAPGVQPLLLFPHDDAQPLAAYANGAPITLVVPDGTWRQASKVRNRIASLHDVPCVTLPAGAPSRYRLRAAPHPSGLATLEAIARAMGILEGPDVQAALEHVFGAVVGRTLWARGELDACDVIGGVPAGAMRHDPRSGLRPLAALDQRASTQSTTMPSTIR